jgi:iron complex outermembrane receptor protein
LLVFPRRLALAALGPLAATAVAARPAVAHAQQATTGAVSGRVTTGDAGEPIPGATVAVTGTTLGAITRADGSFRITLRPGTYELRARLVGFASARDTIVVTAGGTTTRNFRLSRAASTLDAVAVVGSRTQPRTLIESPAPVDVLAGAEIRSTGRTETNQIIQQLAPSFNFPRPSIADGTDHVRPATLRGLGPDQVLVLVNGKRRHNSALVNVNGTIGRGSTGVDLNAIPASMIDRVEVLRDGAAAQYGSDAIAGVINIVLKSSDRGSVTATAGQNYTTWGGDFPATAAGQVRPEQTARDGRVLQAAGNLGRPIGTNGYWNVGGEVRDRGFSNRSGLDFRRQYFPNDPRNNAPPRPTLRLGDAQTTDVVGFFNTAATLAGGAEVYAFGGLSRREGTSAANWRQPNANNTVRAIYPDGFLPLITTDIWDGSGTGGVRGSALGWRYDLSGVYGRNSLGFGVDSTNNASLGLASPTSFDAGRLAFQQGTANLDLSRELALPAGQPVRVGVGAEFRLDRYRLQAGDSASWINGGQRVLDGPNANSATALPPPGAQGFPGFRPTDAQNASRNNVAGYVDLESDLTRRLLVGVAGRAERYSDFGSTATGRVTSRLSLARGLALRGTAGTGFRAPSLGQSFFSSTATNLIAGQFREIRTLPVNTRAAQTLGARPLKAERSVNLGVGFASQPVRNLGLTVDYYNIYIRDRIVLSGNFIGDTVRTQLEAIGISGVQGARYFTNAINTRTQGVDVVSNYTAGLGAAGQLRLTAGFNATRNRVTRVIPNPPQLGALGANLFAREERGRVEVGQPRTNLLSSASYDLRRLTLTARTQRFGTVTSIQPVTTPQIPDQTFGAKWITDLSASVRLVRSLSVTVGSDNVGDVYPDRNSDFGNPAGSYAGNGNFGLNPYSGISPFGFNGRFAYARLNYAF